ncbi:hypothetical protein RND81_13G157900 [Saponaria officinalis]|uniref:F-box domain-containing protein n=1 Tax=Saponaria officinalis TaxID=3572 RepID=A0AAW1GYI5_SAPOF
MTYAQSVVEKLPQDIISKILKCLPLHDAAKLCSISRAWFSAWKELHELRFDARFFAKVLKNKTPMAIEFCNIVSVILLSHVGPISGFYLCIPELKRSTAPDIGPWISFLSRSNIKDITIKNLQMPPLKLSYHLFSCLNLEKLTLDNCVLNLLPSFNVLRYLKSIEFERVMFMGNSLTDFIASCTILQSLTLKNCTGFEYIDIVAPNLKYLTVSGKFESVYLRSAANLICLSVTLEEMVVNYQSARTCDLIGYLSLSCNIEKVSFGGHFCKFLTAGKIRRISLKYFRFLKSLQLSNIETNDPDEFFWVLEMIKGCPVVEDLKISFSSTDSTEHINAFDRRCQFSRLRKVHLSSVSGVTMELKLIEFLLRCSPTLETMHVVKDVNITDALESRLTRELMYYCRASRKAKVVYVD